MVPLPLCRNDSQEIISQKNLISLKKGDASASSTDETREVFHTFHSDLYRNGRSYTKRTMGNRNFARKNKL